MAKKIFLFWLFTELAFVSSYFLFDKPIEMLNVAGYSIQWLLFIITAMITRNEPIRKNKYIFLNFALFFSVSLAFHIYNLIDNPYLRLYISEYVSFGAYFFLLAFAVIYLCLDALFRDFKVRYKYLLALGIVGGFFFYYYQGVISDPMYLYSTNEAKAWKSLDEARSKYIRTHHEEPTAEILARIADLKVWKDGNAIGMLFPEEKLNLTKETYPYLSGDNFKVLYLRPLCMSGIYMCVLCVGFILLFFGYQYMKDPPQGAYIDKIMFLFLVFSTMEIMHAWSMVKSIEWQSFYELMRIGQVVSQCILLLMAAFFGLRLRFIRSVKGEFYEQEILASPGSVTRWRDDLDNLLISHFFNRKALLGRLFVASPVNAKER